VGGLCGTSGFSKGWIEKEVRVLRQEEACLMFSQSEVNAKTVSVIRNLKLKN
jgi:hypothetical protein